MSMKWESCGGLTVGHFALAGLDWSGPESPETMLSDDDEVKGIRGVFTRPDGSKRLLTTRYLARTTKHTSTPVEVRK